MKSSCMLQIFFARHVNTSGTCSKYSTGPRRIIFIAPVFLSRVLPFCEYPSLCLPCDRSGAMFKKAYSGSVPGPDNRNLLHVTRKEYSERRRM